MATLHLPPLHQVRGVAEGSSLSGLKTAEQVSGLVRMSTQRILELTQAQVLPHVRIDGGEPLFNLQALKQYVRRYLTTVYEGAPLPLDLRPVVLQPISKPVPPELMLIHDRLAEFPSLDTPPCIYFLIEAGVVVYVGQTRNLAGRLVQHQQDGKTWERVLFFAVSERELLKVETEWITALKPRLNRAGRRSGRH